MAVTQEISRNDASALQADLEAQKNLYLPKSWLIDKAVLIDALGLDADLLEDFSGIRIYPGAKFEKSLDIETPPTGYHTVTLITVAVDSDGNDILGAVDADVVEGSKVYDFSSPCPMHCPNNVTSLSSNSLIYKVSK